MKLEDKSKIGSQKINQNEDDMELLKGVDIKSFVDKINPERLLAAQYGDIVGNQRLGNSQ